MALAADRGPMQMEHDTDDASPAVEPMTDDTNIVLQVARCLLVVLMASGLRLNVFAVVGLTPTCRT